MRLRRRGWCWLLPLGVACAGDAPKATTKAAGAAARPAAAALPCVLGDLWAPCTLEKRLENAGLIPILVDSAASLPMFSRPARHYTLGRGTLYVVLYPDSVARLQDQALLDTVRVQRPGGTYAWEQPPTLILSRNVSAVLLTGSELLTIRIQDQLTAGLPALQRR